MVKARESLTITAAIIQVNLGKLTGSTRDLNYINVAAAGTSAMAIHRAWADLVVICSGHDSSRSSVGR